MSAWQLTEGGQRLALCGEINFGGLDAAGVSFVAFE